MALEIMSLLLGAAFPLELEDLLLDSKDSHIVDQLTFLEEFSNEVLKCDGAVQAEDAEAYVANLLKQKEEKEKKEKQAAEQSCEESDGELDPAIVMKKPAGRSKGKGSGKSKPERSDGPKWIQEHQNEVESWLEKTGPGPEVVRQYPGLLALTAREMDILVCKGTEFPSKDVGTIDLSPSI
eukprot:11891724-Karenia_brevis.AAC.1